MADLKALKKRLEASQGGKKAGRVGVINILGSEQAPSEVVEAIPTGLAVLDHWVLGCGGWPIGRVSEVFSEPGYGKTTLMLAGFAQAQRMGGAGVLVDQEHAIDRDWMELHGVDHDNMLVITPDSLEEALRGLIETVKALEPGDGPYLIGWDSLAAGTPQAEFDGDIGEHNVGVRARLVNRAFRQLPALLKTKRAHLLVINQVREKIGVMFGDPTTTPGGAALKHTASIRLRILGGTKIKGTGDKSTDAVGRTPKFKTVKNRFAPPDRIAEARLYFDERGWDDRWATVSFAKTRGILKPTQRLSAATLTEAWKGLGWPESLSDCAPVSSVDGADQALGNTSKEDHLPVLEAKGRRKRGSIFRKQRGAAVSADKTETLLLKDADVSLNLNRSTGKCSRQYSKTSTRSLEEAPREKNGVVSAHEKTVGVGSNAPQDSDSNVSLNPLFDEEW